MIKKRKSDTLRRRGGLVTKERLRQSKDALEKELNASEPEDGIFTARQEVEVLLKRVGLTQKDIYGVMKKIDKIDKDKTTNRLKRASAEEVKELQKFGREIGLTPKDIDRRIKEIGKINKGEIPPTTTGRVSAEELKELEEGMRKMDKRDKANKVGIWSKDFDKRKRKYIEKTLKDIDSDIRRAG